MNKYGVFIGRFQPVHNGHLSTIRQALDEVETLIIVLGSANACRTIKNPWSAEQRQEMLEEAIANLGSVAKDQYGAIRVRFIHQPDYTYNDNSWIISLQEKVAAETWDNGDQPILLFGHKKDDSSYYLNLFPQWQHATYTKIIPNLDATYIRSLYFDCNLTDLQKHVPPVVTEYLRSTMMLDSTTRRPGFINLQHEYEFVNEYREQWKVRITPHGPGVPYPVTFVTVDAVCIQSGHVLVVRRGGYPGKGLIALPGGFVNPRERIQDAAIRELKEETRIALPKEDLAAAIISSRVFDHPDRSLRGRTITHGFCLNLGLGPLPKVKGDDDADKAWWMPLREAMAKEPEFYEDHFHIIQYFTSRF